MNKLITLLLVVLVLGACQQSNDKKAMQSEPATLKDYQRYALENIKDADYRDQAFPASDSFYLWSFTKFGRQFSNNRITRTLEANFYHYVFWIKTADSYNIYMEDSIPRLQLKKDTLYDVNNDGLKDLVVTYDNRQAQYASLLSKIFVFDSLTARFSSFGNKK